MRKENHGLGHFTVGRRGAGIEPDLFDPLNISFFSPLSDPATWVLRGRNLLLGENFGSLETRKTGSKDNTGRAEWKDLLQRLSLQAAMTGE